MCSSEEERKNKQQTYAKQIDKRFPNELILCQFQYSFMLTFIPFSLYSAIYAEIHRCNHLGRFYSLFFAFMFNWFLVGLVKLFWLHRLSCLSVFVPTSTSLFFLCMWIYLYLYIFILFSFRLPLIEHTLIFATQCTTHKNLSKSVVSQTTEPAKMYYAIGPADTYTCIGTQIKRI